jgi:hypothetical protein
MLETSKSLVAIFELLEVESIKRGIL